MLKRLKTLGITILVSTPYMDEATLCDRIALMQRGQILSIDTPQSIINAFPDHLFAVKAGNMYNLLRALQHNKNITDSYAFGEYAHVVLPSSGISPEDVQAYLRQQGLAGVEWRKADVTIEDCFIKLLKV
jgi:ABC-type multidrug transport system ATPase subunit